MTYIFKIDNLLDMEDAYSRTKYGGFALYLWKQYNLPMYFYVKDGEINGHQDVNDDGTWYSRYGEDLYNRAAPYEVFKHPEKYPEYYI